jgi:hypothetical protein
MLTTIAIAAVAALAGYVVGRAHRVGRHHEHEFQGWRDRVIGAALLPTPSPLLELTADEVRP